MRRSFLLSLALAGAGLSLSVPAAAQDLAARTLAPGSYTWASDAPSQGAVRVVVSIPRQLAYVYRGEQLIGLSTVSTGKEGHETPVGSFTILQKRETYFSNIYDSAPMPWMQRLTWDGIALHAGQIPGRPASHGCVRLPAAFAKQLFALTSLGATVTITDEDPAAAPAPTAPPPEDLLPEVTASNDAKQTPIAHAERDRAVQLASFSR